LILSSTFRLASSNAFTPTSSGNTSLLLCQVASQYIARLSDSFSALTSAFAAASVGSKTFIFSPLFDSLACSEDVFEEK